MLKVMLLAGAVAGARRRRRAGGRRRRRPAAAAACPAPRRPRYDPAEEYAKAVAAMKAKDYKDAERARPSA